MPPNIPTGREGLTQVDFGELKQKLLGSIVGIAAVDALAWYFDLEKVCRHLEAGLGAGFPVDVRRRHADAGDRRPARPPHARPTNRRVRASGEGLLTIPGVNPTSGFGSNRVGIARMRVTRALILLFAVAIAAGGCAQHPVVRYQMVAAPAPQGIDNVIYGSPTAPGYGMASAIWDGASADLCNGRARLSDRRAARLRAPAYTPAAYNAPAYGMAAAPAYGAPAVTMVRSYPSAAGGTAAGRLRACGTAVLHARFRRPPARRRVRPGGPDQFLSWSMPADRSPCRSSVRYRRAA